MNRMIMRFYSHFGYLLEFSKKHVVDSDRYFRCRMRSNEIGLSLIYVYEGQLSDIETSKFCCAGKADSIPRHYLFRWNNETGYRCFKDMLGFDPYQMQSYQAIKRF